MITGGHGKHDEQAAELARFARGGGGSTSLVMNYSLFSCPARVSRECHGDDDRRMDIPGSDRRLRRAPGPFILYPLRAEARHSSD